MARTGLITGAPAPVVAVTGSRRRIPWAWWATRASLHAVGAKALHLRPGDGWHPELFDAVVVGGGDDIGAGLYDPEAVDVAPPDPERDRYEIDVIEHVLDTGIPVLGICRGAQLLNVVLGGSLHQDVRPMRRHNSNRSTLLPRRTVTMQEHSRLAGILGTSVVKVNALHRQAVDRVGEGLTAVAWDADGIVQAVEQPDGAFRVGVQWHPEYLGWQRRQRRLFARLADHASAPARLRGA